MKTYSLKIKNCEKVKEKTENPEITPEKSKKKVEIVENPGVRDIQVTPPERPKAKQRPRKEPAKNPPGRFPGFLRE